MPILQTGEEKKEGKMTETQRAMLEAKIMQLQQATLDLAQKLTHEKRDRDQDMDQVSHVIFITSKHDMSLHTINPLYNNLFPKIVEYILTCDSVFSVLL